MAEKWIGYAQRKLQEHADRLFKDWLETSQGKKWQKAQYGKGAKKSPYQYGFSLPDYHHELIKATGKNDEETAKYLLLVHYI